MSLAYLHLLCIVLFEDVAVYFAFLLIFSSHITESIIIIYLILCAEVEFFVSLFLQIHISGCVVHGPQLHCK